MIYQPRRPPRHEHLTIRGLRHRLTRWGPPGDSPVVLLHGWMDAGETWQFVVDHLPDSWSCVAPDWRGYGGSERSKEGYWFPDYLADLDALLEVLAPRGRARVVGHSMGGNIATLYGGIRPHRLAWLADLEGVGLPRTSPEAAPQQYERWLNELRDPPLQRRYPSVDELAALLRARNDRLTPPRARFIARAWSRPTGSGIELAADARHRIVNPVLYRREEAEACWRRMQAPVLLLFGALSSHRARLGADGTDDYFRSALHDVRIATIAGAGHMMHHEEPETVARHIVEFAREVSDAAA